MTSLIELLFGSIVHERRSVYRDGHMLGTRLFYKRVFLTLRTLARMLTAGALHLLRRHHAKDVNSAHRAFVSLKNS